MKHILCWQNALLMTKQAIHMVTTVLQGVETNWQSSSEYSTRTSGRAQWNVCNHLPEQHSACCFMKHTPALGGAELHEQASRCGIELGVGTGRNSPWPTLSRAERPVGVQGTCRQYTLGLSARVQAIKGCCCCWTNTMRPWRHLLLSWRQNCGCYGNAWTKHQQLPWWVIHNSVSLPKQLLSQLCITRVSNFDE
jgi:hypothetical protein